MATYILLSSLNPGGLETLKERPDRLKEVNQEIERMGATIKEQFAVLGPFDFVTILEAPDNATVSKISVVHGRPRDGADPNLARHTGGRVHRGSEEGLTRVERAGHDALQHYLGRKHRAVLATLHLVVGLGEQPVHPEQPFPGQPW